MPAISRMLGLLEKRGYVERTVSASNRRKTYVRITESGRKVFARSKQTMEIIIKKVYEKMGKEDMEQFIKLWEKLGDIIATEIDEYIKEQTEVNRNDRQSEE